MPCFWLVLKLIWSSDSGEKHFDLLPADAVVPACQQPLPCIYLAFVNTFKGPSWGLARLPCEAGEGGQSPGQAQGPAPGTGRAWQSDARQVFSLNGTLVSIVDLALNRLYMPGLFSSGRWRGVLVLQWAEYHRGEGGWP